MLPAHATLESITASASFGHRFYTGIEMLNRLSITLTLAGAWQTSRVCVPYFVRSPRSWTPTEPAPSRLTMVALLPAMKETISASAS